MQIFEWSMYMHVISSLFGKGIFSGIWVLFKTHPFWVEPANRSFVLRGFRLFFGDCSTCGASSQLQGASGGSSQLVIGKHG